MSRHAKPRVPYMGMVTVHMNTNGTGALAGTVALRRVAGVSTAWGQPAPGCSYYVTVGVRVAGEKIGRHRLLGRPYRRAKR